MTVGTMVLGPWVPTAPPALSFQLWGFLLFLSRIEKGDVSEEEDFRLACRHERYPTRKCLLGWRGWDPCTSILP